MKIKSISWITVLGLLFSYGKVNGRSTSRSTTDYDNNNDNDNGYDEYDNDYDLNCGSDDNGNNDAESNFVAYHMGRDVNHVPFHDTSSMKKEIEDETMDLHDEKYLRTINPEQLYDIDNIYNNSYNNPIRYLHQVNKFVKRNMEIINENYEEEVNESTETTYFSFGSQLDGFSLFVYETLIDLAFSSTKGVRLSSFYYYGVSYFEQVKDSDVTALISSGYSAFTYDYPEVWWHKKIGFSISKDTKGYVNKVAFQIVSDQTATEISTMTANIDIETDAIINDAPKTTDFDKLKYLHDTLITNIEYNMTATHRFSIYGAIVEHRAVCEGYGESFKLLARKLGIDVICVPSTEHLWNFAKIEDSWYLVDVTFDDPGTTNSNGEVVYASGNGNNIIYTYFLVGQDFFKSHSYSVKTHTINKSLTYVTGTKEFEFPEIAKISYVTKYKNQFGVSLLAYSIDGATSSTKHAIQSIMFTSILGLFLILYYII